jgi:GrpB-like predicted nucleotidyltransferase (UPF0157 family)
VTTTVMITIADYNPDWPKAFAALRDVLEAALGPALRGVEHVGSTAVEGLPAKPIIDIDVVIASPAALPEAIRRLAQLGYFHQGDLGVPGREAFGRRGADVPRGGSGRSWPEHHLYVCPPDGAELKRHVLFRDVLRTHPGQVERYAALKRRLAREHGDDLEAYVAGKTAFVEEVLALVGWRPGESRAPA